MKTHISLFFDRKRGRRRGWNTAKDRGSHLNVIYVCMLKENCREFVICVCILLFSRPRCRTEEAGRTRWTSTVIWRERMFATSAERERMRLHMSDWHHAVSASVCVLDSIQQLQRNPKHRIREECTRLTASSEILLSKDPFVLWVCVT